MDPKKTDQNKVDQNKTKEETSSNNFNKKLDEKMENIMQKGFLEKILNNKIVIKIIESEPINKINDRLQPRLKKILRIIGWLSIIGGVFGIFVGLSALFASFVLAFGAIFILYIIITLAFSLLTILTGFGVIKFKKWAVLLVIIEFVLSLVSFVVTIIYSGFTGGSLVNILLSFLLTVLVIKNKELFKN